MGEARLKTALIGLQWALGLVILIEAALFVMPASGPEFTRTHMPHIVRLVLGWGEIIGVVVMLLPRTAARGAWFLAAVFVLAIAIHLLHGMYNVGHLVIYTAAACVVAVSK
jgi:hypothetical protein